MKVKAVFPEGKYGFYGTQRRRNGDIFTLTDPAHFSERWMEKLDEDKPKRGPKPKAKAGVVEESGE